jgi:putative membrane protein
MAVEYLNPVTVAATILYSTLGVVVFWLSFIIIDKITPYDLWKEIVEERNVALATIVAAMCIGIAIIVAAAIH